MARLSGKIITVKVLRAAAVEAAQAGLQVQDGDALAMGGQAGGHGGIVAVLNDHGGRFVFTQDVVQLPHGIGGLRHGGARGHTHLHIRCTQAHVLAPIVGELEAPGCIDRQPLEFGQVLAAGERLLQRCGADSARA